jgi:hypothetical protein
VGGRPQLSQNGGEALFVTGSDQVH